MRKIFISDYDGTIKTFTRCSPSAIFLRIHLTISPSTGKVGSLISRQWRRTSACAHGGTGARGTARSQPGGSGLGRVGRASAARRLGTLGSFGWLLLVRRARSQGAGVAATVYSNPGRLQNGRGLVLEKLDPSPPFHSAWVGVDKSAVVRHALRVADTVAFARDGPPDLQPSLLVWPNLRFARGFLAEALWERGEALQPYSRWSEIARKLVL
jgi:hypothetical protein